MNLNNQTIKTILEQAQTSFSERSSKFSYLHQVTNREDNYIPLSGNSWAVNEYISLYANNDSLTYKIYLLEERYWTELFRIKSGSCPQLERIWKSVMVIAWNYGLVAIKKISDKFEPLGLLSYKLNINQDVERGEGFVNNVSFLGVSNQQPTRIKLGSGDSVMGKYNYRGVSAVWLFLPLCKNIKKHFTSYVNNLIFNTKKIKYTVKNDDVSVINEELRSIFNIDNNIIYQIQNSDVDNLGNEVEVLDKPNNDNRVLQDLNAYIKRWYYMLGRRYSFESEKAERMITNEFAQDELNYVLVENEIETELQKLVNRFNKKWGFKAILEKVVERVKIKEAATEEFINHGDEQSQQ